MIPLYASRRTHCSSDQILPIYRLVDVPVQHYDYEPEKAAT